MEGVFVMTSIGYVPSLRLNPVVKASQSQSVRGDWRREEHSLPATLREGIHTTITVSACQLSERRPACLRATRPNDG